MRNFAFILFLSFFTLSVQSTDDFSSPQTLIETFIKASTKKNKKVLSQCFSKSAPSEWDAIRNMTISKKDLEELKEFISGATITKTEMNGEDHAVVHVTFKSRKEKIQTVKEDGRWVISDF